nr:hypothetical protein [Phaeobacter inhibens]
MAQPLSEQSKAIVTATVPALEAHGGAIVAEMYTRLLADEDIKALFNQSHQQGDSSQHAALANAILAMPAISIIWARCGAWWSGSSTTCQPADQA